MIGTCIATVSALYRLGNPHCCHAGAASCCGSSTGCRNSYDLKLEDYVGADERARAAFVVLSYVSGRALAAPRHTASGTVLLMLNAMWTETRDCGAAMVGAAAGAAWVQAVVDWLAESELNALLAEFTVPRLGSPAHVLTTGIQHHGTLSTVEQRMRDGSDQW